MTDFVYTIKAHPTSYKGVNFRSRLEATWAAFFDLADIPWSYEPIDLNGWVPDFILYGKVAVEIKPLMCISEIPQDTVSRMKASGWPGPLAMFPNEPTHFMGRLGWFFTVEEHEFKRINLWDGEVMMAGENWLKTEQFWNQAKNLTQWKPA